MARLTDEQWELARMDYEVHGYSYSQIVDKYNTSKGSISNRSKKENWQQGKVERIVEENVNAIKSLREVERKVERLEPIVQKSIETEVNERLAQEQFFTNSAMKNQEMANQLLELPVVDEDGEPTGAIDLRDLNQHSQITARNKETILGKNPDTAIQVNNNVSPISSNEEFKRIAKEVINKV